MRRRNPADGPLLRAAARIAASPARPAGDDRDPARDVATLLDRCRTVERLDRLRTLAAARGRLLAAGRVRADLLRAVRHVHDLAAGVLAHGGRPDREPVTLRGVADELRQLAQEFDDVRFDLKAGTVVARTGPVELAGVTLGPFAVELHLGRLAGRRDAGCFDCVALDPNPASANDAVTHPHVQDRQLCAGDASAPIAAALAQGRVCDAFCLVRSVLHAYNAGSAYVALDGWDGVACDDCGRTVARGRTSYCDHCGRDYCGGCTGSCDVCGDPCCRSCLDRDAEAGTDCCPACRTDCAGCGRVVARDDADGRTGLCPQCRDDRAAEKGAEEDDEQEPEPQQELPHEPEQHLRLSDPGQPGTDGERPPGDRQPAAHAA